MKLAIAIFLLIYMSGNAQDNYNLVVGTYTNTCESDGLYVYDFNITTGEAKLKGGVGKPVINPSFFTVSADKKFIYCVNENGKDSEVSSFEYNAATGKISLLNKRDAKGDDPCHIISDDKNVITANYSGGSIEVFGKEKDGSLTRVKQVVEHSGSSVNKERQGSPHVHMVRFSPDRKYVFATDLGTDKIYVYSYNPNGGDKTLMLKETVTVKPGSGPRHMVFNPSGIFLYVLNELDASLAVYSLIKGKLQKIQESTVASQGFTGKNGAADIRFSRDGKYIYATNRGDANTLSVFKVHANGRINIVQQVSVQGEGPRNLVLGPKDNFVLVGNQQSNNVVIFKRDKTTGMLEDTGKRIEVCAPVCLVFTEAR